VRFVVLGADGAVPPEGADAHALLRVALTKPDLSAALTAAPGVRWVHTSTAGFDWAMVPEITERGITLTRSASSYAIPIGEFTLTLIAALAKRLPELRRRNASGAGRVSNRSSSPISPSAWSAQAASGARSPGAVGRSACA
jgi:phosphoglycerate dehydrogenase-like enzyme